MKGKIFLALQLFFSFFLTSCCSFPKISTEVIPLTEPVPPFRELSNLKYNEAWFGVVFNGEKKIGFNHYRIEKYQNKPDIYKISSEAFLKFSALGMKQEINLKETDYVNPDLSLIRFSAEQQMGEKKLFVSGEVKGNDLSVEIKNENEVQTQRFELKEALYSSVATNLYPALKGFKIGEVYKYKIYAAETQSLEDITQEILSYEKSNLYQGPAFRVKTSSGFLSINSWINRNGETLLEMDKGGLLIITKEDELSARKFIYRESFTKDDILLDYSLVKSDKDIKGARKLKTLDLKLIGMDEDFPVISDERQKAKRITEKGISKVEYLIDSLTPVSESTSALPVEAPDLNEFLKPTLHIQSNNQEIISKSKEIIGDEKNSLPAVKKLTQWVSEEIKDKLVDSFSSLNVLHSMEGECQSHTYLYTAFARAAGIPTKVVNGIVYLEPKGFLYHTWAESYVGYWIAVDPTFGQIPVDATHIKLVEGDSFDELSPLINIIGKIRAEVIEYK